MRNRMYGGVRGRKTKVGRKLLRFPPTRLYLDIFRVLMPKRAECTICLTNYARVLRKTCLAIPCTNWILAIVVYLKTNIHFIVLTMC